MNLITNMNRTTDIIPNIITNMITNMNMIIYMTTNNKITKMITSGPPATTFSSPLICSPPFCKACKRNLLQC